MKYRTEWKNIQRMVYPVLLNYALGSVFEILDKAIVGHYSIRGFAMVGIAASLIYAVTGALGVLSVSFHIIAAEAKGKQDESHFQRIFVISKSLAVIVGLLFFVLCLAGSSLFFENVYRIRGDDLQELLSYFYPAAFTVVQNMVIFQYSAYFRNNLDTKITLYSTIVSTGVNLFFDYGLVYGAFGLPQMGTAGAAWGSVIGLCFGLLVYQVKYYRKVSFASVIRQLKNIRDFIAEGKRILRLYPSLLGQELLESTIFVLVVSSVVVRLGTESTAVYNLLDSVSGVIGLPVFAYATAAQTFALQKNAAGKKQEAGRYLKTGMSASLIAIFILCMVCAFFHDTIFCWIISDADVIRASGYMMWMIFPVVLVKIPYQICMSYLQGIGKEKFVFLCTAAGMTAASAGALILGPALGLPGIYLAVLLQYLILSVIYVKQSGKAMKA